MADLYEKQRYSAAGADEHLRCMLIDRLEAGATIACPIEFASAMIGVCASQSCGKCVPCRVGLVQLKSLIDDVLDGTATRDTIDLIERTARSIYLTADCAIGFEAGDLALTAVIAFRDDFEHHVDYGRCGTRRDDAVPCLTACPAHVDVPGYMALAHEGRYVDAVRLIRRDNPFAVVCGLVCEHPCEDACRRGMVDHPLNIRGIKRFVTEHAADCPMPERQPATGKRVAIVGGGPAGLTAAYYLALRGHAVTVFDQREQLGGMLRYGIPAYRLPRERLDEEITWILRAGIETRTGVSVGTDISLAQLRADFDAVYLAIGAHEGKKLHVDGEDAEGVMSAVEFLRGMDEGVRPDVAGKRVVVVGGGNVAMDAARTSVRLGAESVTVAYRRRVEDMTAQEVEVVGAKEEGVAFVELSAPAAIEEEGGRAVGLRVQRQIIGGMRDGRPSVRAADAEPSVIPADVVIVAIGQAIGSAPFAAEGVPLSRDRIAAAGDQTIEGMPGVFAGGECVTGPRTVIMAVAAGKRAADRVDAYLGFDRTVDVDVDVPHPGVILPSCGRAEMFERGPALRSQTFDQVEMGLTDEEAQQESARCLRCDRFGYGAFRGRKAI